MSAHSRDGIACRSCDAPDGDHYADCTEETHPTYDADRHRLTLAGLTVELWISDLDGRPVVQIDTTTATGQFRVNVNDADIWDRDAEDES